MHENSNDLGHLVLTDVDAVQKYLFSSVRLAMISGASRIIVEFDQRLLNEANQRNGQVLTHSGGSSIVLFDNEKSANEFANVVQGIFTEMSVEGHLSCVGPNELKPLKPDHFQEGLEAAYIELEKVKRLGFNQGNVGSHAMARRCATCGREVAAHFDRGIEPDTDDDTLNWVGDACFEKWKTRKLRWKNGIQHTSQDGNEQKAATDWLDWLAECEGWSSLNLDQHLAYSFEELAPDRQRIATILADVDGVGDRRSQIDSPSKLKRFADGLATSLRASLVHAIDQSTKSIQQEVLNEKYKLPIAVLFHGGDDLVIACQAQYALPLVLELTTKFKECNEANVNDWNWGEPLGLSAAVVMSGRGFPFRLSHKIGSRLLREAKRTARAEADANCWRHGAVDMTVITEASADPALIVEDRGIVDGDESCFLTGRPYCVANGSPRSLSAMKSAAIALQNFPRSRLHELRQICSRSSLDETERPGALYVDWRNKFRDWQHRTNRNSTTKTEWDAAMQQLGVHTDLQNENLPVGMIEHGDGNYRTCVGDFADMVELWSAKR